MVALVFDSAAWELERLGRPGRISALGADVPRLLSDLVPLVHAQNHSADPEPYRTTRAALALRQLCSQLVDALDGKAPAEALESSALVAKRSWCDGRLTLLGLQDAFPEAEELILSFHSAQDLARLDCVCRHFHGPVGSASPVRSAVLRAARSRHPSVSAMAALGSVL